jgi:hypothetical protein
MQGQAMKNFIFLLTIAAFCVGFQKNCRENEIIRQDKVVRLSISAPGGPTIFSTENISAPISEIIEAINLGKSEFAIFPPTYDVVIEYKESKTTIGVRENYFRVAGEKTYNAGINLEEKINILLSKKSEK